MRFELVLLDLDGTLIDTLADIAAACNRTLAAHGLPVHPEHEYRAYVGEGARRLIELAAAGQDAETIDALEAEFRADYGEHLIVASRPYPGIEDLLAGLGRRGLARAVLTNKPQAMAERVVGALLPDAGFLEVVGHRPELPRKPDPASALSVCRAAGLAPEAAAVVGDTWVDVETARRAGMTSIGITWGFRDRAEHLEAGADYIADSPAEALSILTGS